MNKPWLNFELLDKAKSLSLAQEEPLLTSLQRLSNQSPEAMLAALSLLTGIEVLSLAQMENMVPDFSILNYAECLQRECLLLSSPEYVKYFISTNPLDHALYNWASYRLKGPFRVAFSHPLELKAMLFRLESHQQAITQLIRLDQTVSQGNIVEEISLNSIANDDSQVVRLVNSTLYDAHKSAASDIHFENSSQGLTIKYRIDGVLSEIRQLADPAVAEQVISRIKVMAELDIGEKRIPQDGRFSVSLQAREIDFRVSVMPGLFGEDVVLRILDKQSISTDLAKLNLDMLGIDAETKAVMRKLANQPYGMLLVTGPTGSGKTTSLYAVLSEINYGADKIITIEDPIEYQLPGILQIPVNEKKGLTFARGLRSILRHDPDRILVGEIRDRETAEIAIQAALTGHLVYTTVHANNAFDVLSRFRHMGVDSYSFLSSLNGVIAQRLVRLNCTHCAEPYDPDDELLATSGIDRASIKGHPLKQGRGCLHCRGTGYKGRFAIAEVLVLDDKIRESIIHDAPISGLKELAVKQGMRPMREQGLKAVKLGHTTLQEINRVIFVE